MKEYTMSETTEAGSVSTAGMSSVWTDSSTPLVTNLTITEWNDTDLTTTEAPVLTQTPWFQMSMFDISLSVYKYGVVVLGAIGTVGNILALVVLSRKNFRTTTTSVFLRVLAVFDLLAL